jgi:hypothetical protein
LDQENCQENVSCLISLGVTQEKLRNQENISQKGQEIFSDWIFLLSYN